jgi:hypothetical protein
VPIKAKARETMKKMEVENREGKRLKRQEVFMEHLLRNPTVRDGMEYSTDRLRQQRVDIGCREAYLRDPPNGILTCVHINQMHT